MIESTHSPPPAADDCSTAAISVIFWVCVKCGLAAAEDLGSSRLLPRRFHFVLA